MQVCQTELAKVLQGEAELRVIFLLYWDPCFKNRNTRSGHHGGVRHLFKSNEFRRLLFRATVFLKTISAGDSCSERH